MTVLRNLFLAFALLVAGISSADAASRFWVGGTGTWDAATTTHWAATTGGAGGQSVPGSADTVTLDGASGGGTVTVSTDFSVTSLTCGAFTGTLTLATNNNNPTMQTFSCSGAGTRTLSMGNGTWTITGTSGTVWDCGTTTGFTLNANSSTLLISATPAASRSFTPGSGLTYNAVSLVGAANNTAVFTVGGGATLASVSISNIPVLRFQANSTTTITTPFTLAGSSSVGIVVTSNNIDGLPATLSVASGNPTFNWAALYNITATGGATFSATNSLNVGSNSGITITPPAGGGGRIIGG